MAADILNEIMDAKRRRVSSARELMSLETLQSEVGEVNSLSQSLSRRRRLSATLSNDSRINIIAEFKRRSPSKGVIRGEADPITLARAYERGGAAAVSVLTEEDFFDGSLADLKSVRQAVNLPILRKDFVFDEYQVWESAAAGADAVLLIVAALSDDKLYSLRQLAEDQLGLDALIEVHSSEELKRAVAAGAKMVGVNNRNLRDFDVSLDVSAQLASEVPAGVILISESGIGSHDDLIRLKDLGYHGFLIGETLMRAEDPEQVLRSLVSA
jgi:indole-3-glycerol phosphate synthase